MKKVLRGDDSRESNPLPELIVDHDAVVPPPLDRRIAAISLRSKTNDPTDGYDLTLSASFGSERITLVSGDLELSVKFAMRSADILLTFVRSDYRLLDVPASQYSEAWRGNASTTSAARGATSVAGSAAISAIASHRQSSLRLGATAKTSASNLETTAAKIAVERPHVDWHLLGDDAIKVGRSGQPLDGPIIADLTCWHVKPKQKDCRSGVIARIVVREEWVTFSEPREVKTPRKFLEQITNLFAGEETKRRRNFMYLLRHLAHLKLQTDSRTNDATLAIAAVVLKPNETMATSRPTRVGGRVVELPADPIERFLFAESGQEVQTLIALGVNPDLLNDDLGEAEPDSDVSSRFVPQSSPLKAMIAFHKLNNSVDSMSMTEAEAKFGRNEIRDLTALGLLKVRKGEVKLAINRVDEPEPYLRHAIGRTKSIAAARAVLRANPSASPELFAAAVAAAIGETWTNPSTLDRHGRTIRRWTLWLEPHLIDPASPRNASLVASALSPVAQRGARTKLTPGMADRIIRLVADGKKDTTIAREIGISVPTLKRYKATLKI